MKLADYWPSEVNILHCIKPEAESDWDEVFLAIHQPMRLVKKAFTTDAANDGETVTEADFLREFLKPDLPTGTLLMPILGNSGIGKSHLVRWLDVQLKRQPDADRRHVIRIPKSSSLKTVLHHILEDLHGKQYDAIRRQLKAAREQLDLIGAEERILAELRAAIRRRYNDAAANRETARARGTKLDKLDDEWYSNGDPQRGLPALLSDPVTSQLFMSGTNQRPGIISQMAEHLTTDPSEERPPRRNFEEADLITPEDIDILTASDKARNYLQSLDRYNGQGRKTVVRLLNSIIDGALQPLASPTDTSLSEIFLQIRRQLLAEGRELVLLVEDFAVLSGIQGALLDAMIREGVRGGVDACIMRTALAVTAGYDFGRYDTVRTRAVYGWYVDETPQDEEDEQILSRICDYVGAYLNAARFGADKLKQMRGDFNDKQWPPRFGDDAELSDNDRAQLDAFGTSAAGWPLFPFNTAAIRQMANLYLRDSNNLLRLNARTIINLLLIRVLRNCRPAWVENQFPPEELLGSNAHRLSATLQAEVRNVEGGRSLLPRYLTLLRYWGDCPECLAETALPQQVYHAFSLAPLPHAPIPGRLIGERKLDRKSLPQSVAEDAVFPRKMTPPARGVDSSPTELSAITEAEPITTSQHPEEVRRWMQRLNEWTSTSPLPQREANELRKMIADHVLGAIDWDLMLLKKIPSDEMAGWHGNVFLPSARGSGNVTPDNAMCTICTNDEFANLEHRTNAILPLIALTRHKHYKTWDYPEAELDYARLKNMLDRLVPQSTGWLLAKKYRGFSGNPVPALVENGLLTARFLNVESAHASDLSLLLKALFTTAPEPPAAPPGNTWAEFKCEAAIHHKLLQEEILARTAVRQSGADATHGLDVVPLLAAIRSFKTRWACEHTLPDFSGRSDSNDAVTFARRFPSRLKAAIHQRQQKLASVRRLCQMELGEQFDKNTLLTKLKNFATQAQLMGLVASELPAPQELQNLLDAFRQARISETLKKLSASEAQDFGTQLSSLTQIDDSVLFLIESFINTMVRTLETTEKRVKAELAAGEGLLRTSTDKIEQTLNTIVDHLKTIEGTAI